MSDDKVILTPDEAAALFPDGDYVHNYANPSGGLFLGIDYDRSDAIAALQRAKQIELGGPGCTAMKHPIVVWENERRCTFFEANMDKVKAFEASRQKVD